MSAAFGPAGIAIGAVVGAVGIGAAAFKLFGDGAKKQVEPVQSLTDAIIQDGNAIKNLTTEPVNNMLVQDGAYAAANKLGIATTTVLQAALGNAQAQADVAAATKVAQDAYSSATSQVAVYGSSTRAGSDATKQASQAQLDAKNAADALNGAVGGTNAQLNASVQAANNSSSALAGLTANANSATNATSRLQSQLGATSAAARNLGNLGGIGAGRDATGGILPSREATGGTSPYTWVGEYGPELMDGNNRVYPHGQSMQMARTMGGGGTVNHYYYTVQVSGLGTAADLGRTVAAALSTHLNSGGTVNVQRGSIKGN